MVLLWNDNAMSRDMKSALNEIPQMECGTNSHRFFYSFLLLLCTWEKQAVNRIDTAVELFHKPPMSNANGPMLLVSQVINYWWNRLGAELAPVLHRHHADKTRGMSPRGGIWGELNKKIWRISIEINVNKPLACSAGIYGD